MRADPTPLEETLDPQDWEAFRRLSHRMVDDTLDFLATVRRRPVWRPVPDAVRTALAEPLPLEPMGAEATYQEFVERIRPYTNGNIHPRFWGWVQGTGTPLAMMADMLASALNPHLAGFDQAPALVEKQVLAWLAELMGLPSETSGVLTSGATMANLIGLAVARHARAGFDVREEGLNGEGLPRLVFYSSGEAHGWCQKAAELLGLGNSAFRRVAADRDYRINLEALQRLLEQDRKEGLQPFCVVGNAGTINTGATDDLRALARLCREEKVWFHVDGAFGALARLSAKLRPIVDGIEEADSVAFDLHKWGYLPFEVGCVLVRDPVAHVAAFGLGQTYFGDTDRGVIGAGLPFADRGVELTRGFRALKVWMVLKAHGVKAVGRLIEQNVAQAQHLAGLIEAQPDLELLAPVALNVVCFRYRPQGCPPERLDALNQEILLRVQESGVAVVSSTVLESRFAIRAAITNHRSRREDFDLFLQTLVEIGHKTAKEFGA